MQEVKSPINGGNSGSKILSQSAEPAGFSSLYSSIFPPKLSFSTSIPVSPSDDYSGDEDGSSPLLVDNLQVRDFACSPHWRLLLEHRDLIDRHSLCLAQLHEMSKEAEELRCENVNLILANRELCQRLAFLIQASRQTQLVPTDYSSMSAVEGITRLCIGESASGLNGAAPAPRACKSRGYDDVHDESPTSVMESDRIEEMGPERGRLPKSISVRSTGYLKTAQAGTSNGAPNSKTIRPRSASPIAQKVIIQEEEMDLPVYNQGMFKTELCNKWQETGVCPYGDHCQFAHGIKELRAVIRHPRYKTEVCRMVLSGDHCPYGHRCHFRHALSEEEKLLALPSKSSSSSRP